MHTTLIVSSSEQAGATLQQLLEGSKWERAAVVSSGEEARRHLLQQGRKLVLINAPLKDEFGDKLARSFADQGVGVILFVRQERMEELADQVGAFGIFVLSKPVNRGFFHQALRLLEAAQSQTARYQQENAVLKEKMEELRLIDRAKWILIRYLNMTEPQAHRYIEKQAMDLRISKREIAQNILKTYET